MKADVKLARLVLKFLAMDEKLPHYSMDLVVVGKRQFFETRDELQRMAARVVERSKKED